MRLTGKEKKFDGEKSPKQFRITKQNIETLHNLSEMHDKSESVIVNEFLLTETFKQTILNKILKILETRSCQVSNIYPIFFGYFTESLFDEKGQVIPNTFQTFSTHLYIKLTIGRSNSRENNYFVQMERKLEFKPMGGNSQPRYSIFSGTREVKDEKILMDVLEEFEWILDEDLLKIE